MSISPLDWDSEFFGFAIGRADGVVLDGIVRDARAAGVVCVYVESPTPLDPDGCDLRLTDNRVVLERAPEPVLSTGRVRGAAGADRAALGPMLDRLAPWSRFARDIGFGPDAARRMYDAWLDRAFAGDDESVGVVEHDGAVAGFVTVSQRRPAEIGLISVAIEGHGLGSELVQWAAGQTSPDALRVATQGDNARALALYERNGFVRVSESLMYHLWLNEND